MDSNIYKFTKRLLLIGFLGFQQISLDFIMVPGAGLEPARSYLRGILSPLLNSKYLNKILIYKVIIYSLRL